ncbi:DMSO/TMAO reductase YedYZ molybdopterin-dependent catalytic subunit [Kibdelosporangium banguiense]|uniref:DMSO/TMAO reductase YedYZ molybdopterin-dependent catalytic subunit n=1 Tax=Kibdelosporangium banguiense TaxID=1365924 RepID=A0ABS4TD19_9PSEU|nr:molybdopterin-dependent oxidoreductase [Kibdelosporangium banguiense]MBP2322322.1 DMSO/TMAO reductase YedYZ molybdopterin-dependent catalytic subunit [Kibdelosporangium banguiense]
MEHSDNKLPAWRAALVGVIAVAAALAAGHLVAGVLDANSSPFLAVGNTAIDITPAPIKDWAISTFGTADKLVLLSGMGVVLLGIAVLAGLLSRRSVTPGTVVAVVIGALGVIAVMVRPDLGQLSILAPVASLLAGVGVFRWLHRLAHGIEESADRRRFMQVSAGVVTGIGVAGLGGQLLAVRTDVDGSRAAVGPLTPAQPAPAVPAGADFAPATPRFITSNRDFYRIDTALSVPKVLAEDWVLRIHGAVDKELTLSYADIRNRPLVERAVTLCCVSNEVGGDLTSTSNFIGVPLGDILADAGVKPGADQLFSTSADGWTCGTPVADVMERGLLAIGMNGEPLPVEHGFPARMVVPGLYGYVSATKWVVDMEFNRFADKEAYWLKRGWAARGPIKTQSRIDTPTGVANGPKVTVSGIAWAQTKGISKVEVRADGGEWQQARLAAEVSLDTWRMWQIDMELPPGDHTIECRATDRTGYTQTDVKADPVPDGATGWHSKTISVR